MPRGLVACLTLLICVPVNAADPSAERGKKALAETAFIKAFWPKPAYDNLWRVWGLKEKPADYEAAVRERFGLHAAPYPNSGYPMGLRKADLLIGRTKDNCFIYACLNCLNHSVRKLFTGLAVAALIVFKLTTTNVSNNTITPTMANNQMLMLTRYVYLSSQLFMNHHVNGTAMTKAMATSFKNSFDISSNSC